jgi:FkbM family methyltransferase
MQEKLKITVLNNLLHLYGLKYNKFGMRTTLSEVLNQIAHFSFKPETVIDVGVADGTHELYKAFRASKILLIEPLIEFERVLQKIARKYKAEYVIAAASNRSGIANINVHSDLSTTSLMNEMEGDHVDGLTRGIPLVIIDELCQEKKLNGPYVIKVDVQGAELAVLDGAQRVLKETELAILEVSLFQFYVHGPQLHDIVAYMKMQGFVVYDIFGGHTRPIDGALAQVDMAFVKEYGRFRENHAYATYDQRKQLSRLSSHILGIRKTFSKLNLDH